MALEALLVVAGRVVDIDLEKCVISPVKVTSLSDVEGEA
jgi:hypothetical protein